MPLPSRRTLLTTALGGFAGLGLWKARSHFMGSATVAGGSRTEPLASPDPTLSTFRRTSRALGTNVSLTLAHADETVVNRAAAAAFEELERVEQSLSVYRGDSTLGRLNAGKSLAAVDDRFLVVLRASLAMSRRTGGGFDVTVQPLWELHARAAKEGRVPTDAELATARGSVDWQAVRLSEGAVRFDKPNMAITFNGIGQGYATDRVRQVLQEHDIRHALIDIGELTSLGEKSHGRPWQIGIQHPRQADAYVAVAKLEGRSLATSGDYATTFDAAGPGARRDHHIFDPSSGHSPTAFTSVSVTAPTALEADALSTALFVVGLERGRELIEASSGVDALFVLKDGSVVKTAGFPIVAEVA